jgi:hypothetical protein
LLIILVFWFSDFLVSYGNHWFSGGESA